MMKGLPSRAFKGFLRDPEGLRKLVGYASGSVAIAVAFLNILTLLHIGLTDPWEIAVNHVVLMILAFGAFAFATAGWKSRIAEWSQVLFFFAIALLSASEARPGDLTGALILIFGLILALEYNFGRKALLGCSLFALLAYPLALALGYSRSSKAYLSQTAAALLGLFLFIVLYGMVALRHRARLQDEAEHLEEKVRERTTELEALLSERSAMLNEIHHRVKNNLQMVASLLRLGTDRSADGKAKSTLDAGVRRIDAMALVHESLYDTERLDKVDLGDYARRLIDAISEGSGFHFDFEEEGQLKAHLDIAVPFGLLLNELATNAQRHAFPGGGGRARIDLASKDSRVELRVSDEGIGMEEVPDSVATGGVGLELVRALASQLHGGIERLPGKGTTWLLSFPLPQESRPTLLRA
ncbi:MAG TPA: sensor histidine kinase [Rectinemataceae bacterium]|nr:sensor histidine kinase [Rectinemataceae bacterium]